jgi:hypothetical protein
MGKKPQATGRCMGIDFSVTSSRTIGTRNGKAHWTSRKKRRGSGTTQVVVAKNPTAVVLEPQSQGIMRAESGEWCSYAVSGLSVVCKCLALVVASQGRRCEV